MCDMAGVRCGARIVQSSGTAWHGRSLRSAVKEASKFFQGVQEPSPCKVTRAAFCGHAMWRTWWGHNLGTTLARVASV